ncbi:MAG: HAD family phosphatase [Phycisphaerales bacterium]|nr:HAD family phosphatase [Phycisphaerales bacterium]
MAIEGVIFDLDGVLIDSAAAHLESWRRLASRHGLSVSDAQFSQTFGRQNRDIIPILWGQPLPPDEVAALADGKEAAYRDIVRGRVTEITMPGARALIRDCHASGMKLAIGSSTPPENVELALGEMGVAQLFSACVTSRDVTRGKPHPDVFLQAADRIDLDPARCVVIEDAPSGIDAALAAGCVAVGLTSHHSREKLAHAHSVIGALTELTAQRLRGMSRS